MSDEVELLRNTIWAMCRRLGFDTDGDEHPNMDTDQLVVYGMSCAEEERSDYDRVSHRILQLEKGAT